MSANNKPARSLAQVNRAVEKEFGGINLARGEKGFLYWYGPAVEGMKETGAYVGTINCRTVAEWVADAHWYVNSARVIRESDRQ